MNFGVQAQLREAQHYASAEALLYTSACWRFAQRQICHTCKLRNLDESMSGSRIFRFCLCKPDMKLASKLT